MENFYTLQRGTSNRGLTAEDNHCRKSAQYQRSSGAVVATARREDLMCKRDARLQSLRETAKLIQLCEDAGCRKAVAKEQFFVTRSVNNTHRISTQYFSCTLLDLAHGVSQRALHQKDCINVIRAMFTTLLTSSRRSPSPPQHSQLPLTTAPDTRLPLHLTSQQTPEAHTAGWEHEYGRLAINSPRTGYEPNSVGNLTRLPNHPANTSSRRPSLCS